MTRRKKEQNEKCEHEIFAKRKKIFFPYTIQIVKFLAAIFIQCWALKATQTIRERPLVFVANPFANLHSSLFPVPYIYDPQIQLQKGRNLSHSY